MYEAGPVYGRHLIDSLKQRWNPVEIGIDGKPFLGIYWMYTRGNSSTYASNAEAKSSKVACMSRKDFVYITTH
jgi:hypothetical protein